MFSHCTEMKALDRVKFRPKAWSLVGQKERKQRQVFLIQDRVQGDARLSIRVVHG